MKVLLAILFVACCLSENGGLAAQDTDGDSAVVENKKEPRPFLGVAFSEGEDGIKIVRVMPEGPASKAGLQTGDVILEVEGSAVGELLKLGEELSKKKAGDKIDVLVRRGDEEMKLPVLLGNRADFERQRVTSGLKAEKPVTDEFTWNDDVSITVDAYEPYAAGSVPAIVLCHQAGWSRGEYQEIAPKLNEMGFNCYAIDQRSGGSVNDIVNETNKRAAAAGKGVAFLDAEKDIVAALKYVRKKSVKTKVILWGSSYSAALSLRIAGERPRLVSGVLAFAPGEYFARFGKPDDWVETSAKKIVVPAFITSAKDELKNWKSIYDAIPGDSKTMFVPETKGNHGSRALWEKFDDHEAYWSATSSFLSQFID